MEEHVLYSTLVFKNKALTDPEEKGNTTTKAGEKPEESRSTVPNSDEEATVCSEKKHKDAVTAGPKVEFEGKAERKTRESEAAKPEAAASLMSLITLSLLCLGILFLVLCVVVIVLLVSLTKVMNTQKATIIDLGAKNNHLLQQNGNLTNQTQWLFGENRILENQTEQLLGENRILENQTEQLLGENRVLANQTEQLLGENRVLANQTEQLLGENRVLANQTEQLLGENRVLANQTEQLLGENRVLANQTEQLLGENRVLANQTELLMEKTRILANQTAELSKEKENLNWTLEAILTFSNFPVKDFCPHKKCHPCLDGWITFNKTCYLFYKGPAPWKTWQQSRQFCQVKNSDLVIIDSPEEQEFVSNHSSHYHDDAHGYWLGLQKVNNTWTWVNGRINSLGYWSKGNSGGAKSFALLIPVKNLKENWNQEENLFENQFICEHKALLRSN